LAKASINNADPAKPSILSLDIMPCPRIIILNTNRTHLIGVHWVNNLLIIHAFFINAKMMMYSKKMSNSCHRRTSAAYFFLIGCKPLILIAINGLKNLAPKE